MNTEQTMEIDKVPFHKLNLGQDDLKEKQPLEVTQSLDTLPSDPTDMGAMTKDETEEEGQSDMEIRL